MTKITQADRDLFITITQQDDYTADSINIGLQFTGEIELIALYRENAELKERAKIVAWLRDGGADDIVETHKKYLLDLADTIEAGEHLK